LDPCGRRDRWDEGEDDGASWGASWCTRDRGIPSRHLVIARYSDAARQCRIVHGIEYGRQRRRVAAERHHPGQRRTRIDATTQPGYSGTPLVAVDGQNTVTPFTINPGTTVRVRGLTIQHGKGNNGGGVVNNSALTLDNRTVASSSATGSGGGIFSAGTLTLYASTVDTNTASGLGGGVLIAGGGTTAVVQTVAGGTATSPAFKANSVAGLPRPRSSISSTPPVPPPSLPSTPGRRRTHPS